MRIKPRYRTVDITERKPPYNVFVPTIDKQGNIFVYRLIEDKNVGDYWNLRETPAINSPSDNLKIEFWLEELPKQERKILYVDLDGVCANYKKNFLKKKELDPEMPYPQATYGFFIELEQIPDAISAVKVLAEHYDVWFLSAPSSKNPLCLAEKNYWIRINFGPEWVDRLILADDKSKCVGDYLIDDHNEGRGQDKFEGELILFGKDNTWQSILEYLFVKDFLYENISIQNI